MASKATTSWPASSTPSNVNSISTVPVKSSAVKVVLAVISLPDASSTASPVSLSMRVPETVYSSPGMQPVYSMVSMIAIWPRAWPSCVPLDLSIAVVLMLFGMFSTVHANTSVIPS